jgi:hypothetical protein
MRGIVGDHEERVLAGPDDEDANKQDQRIWPEIKAGADRERQNRKIT